MVKMITAFTVEADDTATAVADITSKFEGKLLKNSIGLVHCHYEFIDTGVLSAVCEACPFETAGISCSLPATNGTDAHLALTLTVLTSDDCFFTLAGFDGATRGNISSLVRETAERFAALVPHEQPKMVITYAPLGDLPSGDAVSDTFSEVMPGVPLFGTNAVSDEPDFSKSYTIYNGKYSEHGGCFVGLYGELHPRFKMTSLREGTIFNTAGRLGRFDASIVYEIDGMPAWDYLLAKGVTTPDTYRNVLAQPMVFRYADGSTIMRNLLEVNFEDGSLVLAGNVKPGATVDFALISHDDVCHSAKGIASDIVEHADASGAALIYSCATRLWTLGIHQTDEIELFAGILGDIPYSFAYSGGEFFPQRVDGTYINTFQNNNLVVCLF
jgi:hypothetical protein